MLRISQGDAVIFRLTAKDGDGLRINLTGATFTTFIKGELGVIQSFPNDQHTVNPNQTTHRGEYELALSVSDTESLAVGNKKDVLTLVELAESTFYLHGNNILDVLPNVPLM